MQQQRPSCLFVALLVLLVSIGLGALIVLGVRGTRPTDPPPTAAPVVTVLPTGSTAAGTGTGTATPVSPSATAPTEAILATPSRTPVPPLVLVDTVTPTPTETPRPTRTVAVQKG